MITVENLTKQLEQHFDDIIHEKSEAGSYVWKMILGQHPADIATIIENLTPEKQALILKKLSKETAPKIFERLSGISQAYLLSYLDKDFMAYILQNLQTDTLTHFFDYISDELLQEYLKLLQKKQRTLIVSSLNFAPKTAGRLMTSDVLTFPRNFTIKKSITLLQRIGAKRDVQQNIYLTDERNLLAGYIKIQDLVLNKSETSLMDVMQPCEFIARGEDDQEDVARKMKHYDLLSVPIVDEHNTFLGVVTADDIFDVLEEEASDDVYRMSGLSSMEDSYLETPFFSLIKQRSIWLVGLLFLQSFSSVIMSHFDNIFREYTILTFFLTMLNGAGGNTGNQSSTLIIRGLSTGEINKNTMFKAVFKELSSACIIGLILAVASFGRVYFYSSEIIIATTISLSVFTIVVCAMFLGTIIPIILDRFGIDPAHSAAPFLATMMDILGITILCIVSSFMLH
jgi:magnesium transporter